MIWDTIRGHREQPHMFRRSLQRGRLSHAYLFIGPDGIGKRLFARTLAQCLFCERTDEVELDACGQCGTCRRMAAGTHPDFLLVGCPEGKSEVPIETFVGSRERRGKEGLCYEISLRPMESRRRIAVIDDADLMNVESNNALLKTLEEPPPYSLIILLATNEAGLLPTIRSRCQQIRFHPLAPNDVAELLLEQRRVEDRTEAATIAALSEGSLTIAAQLLDPALRRLRDLVYDTLSQMRIDSVAAAAKIIEALEQLGGDGPAQRKHARWLIRFIAEFYRLASLERAGSDQVPPIEQVRRFVSRFNPPRPEDFDQIRRLFERTILTTSQLEQNLSVPLCLEGLVSDLARFSRPVFARVS